MALETRNNGSQYFYRKVRKDGHVTSQYSGRGELAYMFDAMERIKQQERQDTFAVENARRRTFKERGQIVNEFERLTQLVTRAALVASGCRTHRGKWRKRRE